MNYIAMAVPFFFVLIAVELLAARILRRPLYRTSDTLADLGCGVASQVLGVFTAGLLAAAYVYLYRHRVIGGFSAGSPLCWVAIFFGVDFCYYWFHRASHEVNFLWAIHVVHHQSEEYNLAVALRQAAFQPLASWVFYLPLALVGFPPVMYFTMQAFNTLYQFWIHTRLIGRLGPLEWVLNTPSHHRVHHGQNGLYIDRNHGGSLIVWDMLFGTYQREREEVLYGVTRPLRSFNPLWANFHAFQDQYREAGHFPKWQDRVKVWFMPPGWTPAKGSVHGPGMGNKPVAVKYDVPLPLLTKVYAFAHFVTALVAGVLLLDVGPPLLRPYPIALSIFALLTLFSVGALCDGRRWARPLEIARLGLVPIACLLWFALH